MKSKTNKAKAMIKAYKSKEKIGLHYKINA